MAEPRDDEFYTGYLEAAPPGIARRVRLAVLALFAVATAVALLLVFGQRGFSAAVYEFGISRDFEGVVSEDPYPTLAVPRPGRGGEAAAASRYYLVGPGKHGANEAVDGLDGQRVQLRGSLLYRDDQTMVEVEPESVEPGGEGASAAAAQSLGIHTLVGRIVDSKCFLGIMKPGATKPHKACAVRCIAGGVPPLFVVADSSGPDWRGPTAYLMLVGADGRALNQEVLELVDEPLEITGEVRRLDDLWILAADPAGYRRLL